MVEITIKFEVSEQDAERFAQGDFMIIPVTDEQAMLVGQTVIETAKLLHDLAAVETTDGMTPEQRFLRVMFIIGTAGSFLKNFIKMSDVLEGAKRIQRLRKEQMQ